MSAIERLLASVDLDPDTHCWVWTGRLGYRGLPRLCVAAHTDAYAHRVAYEFYRGPIPKGLAIEWRCGNRLCVNPDHLTLRAGGGRAPTSSTYDRTPETIGQRQSEYDRVHLRCGNGHWVLGANARTVTTATGEVARKCVTCREHLVLHLTRPIEVDETPREAFRTGRLADRLADLLGLEVAS